jgi:hypothetical protein
VFQCHGPGKCFGEINIVRAFKGPLALAKRRITPSLNIRHMVFIVYYGDIWS